MQTKFLQTNSHLPVSHRCQTRLRSKLCTLLWVCRSRDNRARFSLKAGCVRPAQLVRWLDAGHACVKGLWNYQQLDLINQWESRDQRESPSFPFLFLLSFAWFSTKHDWTHWQKKCSKNSRYDYDLMSTRRKEIVETFQSEVSLLTIGGKIIIDLIEDAILDWTFGHGYGSKWNYYLLNCGNLEKTL